MATEAEISKIALLLWTERGKPANGLARCRDQAKQLLEDRDAICCPVQDTIKQPATRADTPGSGVSMPGAERSEAWPRRREAAEGQINSAGCESAAEAADMSDCLDAIDAALSAARDVEASDV